MISAAAALAGFGLMVALMFLGLHVATVIFAVALLGAVLYLGTPIVNAFGNQFWGAMEDPSSCPSRSISWSAKSSCAAGRRTRCTAPCPTG